MWSPTNVQVTVIRARNLKTKGKSGTNDAYVSIRLGKEKYQTSVQERCTEPMWNEKSEFVLHEKDVEVKLKVYHRNLLGMDDLLGWAVIHLDEIDVHERTRNRWYTLHGKDQEGAEEEKSRGELECVVYFYVENLSGSQLSLSKTDKTKRFSLKRSPGDKPVLKWPNRLSGSVTNLHVPLGRKRSISANDLKENTLLEKENNNSSLKNELKEREVDSDSTSGGNRKDSSNFEDDVTLNDSLKSDGADVKKKKRFFSSKLSLKSKNKKLLNTSKLSQSTLGINVARESFSYSGATKGEKLMRVVPFRRNNPLNDDLANDTNSSDGQTEDSPWSNKKRIQKSIEKNKINEENKNTKIEDVQQGRASHLVNEATDNQSEERVKQEQVEAGADVKAVGRSDSNGKNKRRAPQPTDLNLNGSVTARGTRTLSSSSDGAVLQESVRERDEIEKQNKRRAPQPTDLNLNGNVSARGARTLSSPSERSTKTDDVNENSVVRNLLRNTVRPDNHSKLLTSPELELSRCADVTNGREDGDGTDVDSSSNSRPSSPPVISINYNSRLSGIGQDKSTSKDGTSLDDGDKKLISRDSVTQTQLDSDEPELSAERMLEFYNYSRNDLIKMILDQEKSLEQKNAHVKDLEIYIDNLVVKVIDLQPKILLTNSDSTSDPPSPLTSRDLRLTMTLPAQRTSHKMENSKTGTRDQGSFYGKIVRSVSTRSSTEKKRSPFRAIQAVLK